MNDQVFGVHCSNGFCEFDSYTTTKIYNMKYELIELKEMIDNLKKVKKSDKWGLTDKSEIDLTTYELLVETYLIKKVIDDIFTN